MFRDFNRRVSNIKREVHRKARDFSRPSASAENSRQREQGEQPEKEKNLPDLHKELADLRAWKWPIRPHEHLSYKERQVMADKEFTEIIKTYYTEELHNNHREFIEKGYQRIDKQLNQAINRQKNGYLADNTNEIKEFLKQKSRINSLRKIPKLQEERAKLIDQQSELVAKRQKLNIIREYLEDRNQKNRNQINNLINEFTSKIDKRKARIREINGLLHIEEKYALYNEKAIEYQTVIEKSKQVLDDYQQLRSNPDKYEQEQKAIKEKGDRLLSELHENEKCLADLDQKRPNQDDLQSEKSAIKSNLYTLHTPEDKLFIQRKNLAEVCENRKKLYQKITEEQQDEKFRALAGKLKQNSDKAEALKKELTDLTSPQNYNPYYSMDDQKNEQIVNNLVVTQLENSCGVQTIRRALYLLNGNTSENVADEAKIAEAANYSAEVGTYPHDAPGGYKLFGFDYIYSKERLTIDDIDRITSNGFPVHIRVYKEEIGGHALLIEKVTRSEKEKGEIFVTIFDPNGGRTGGMRVRDIPYRKLEKVLTDDYVIPANWREL